MIGTFEKTENMGGIQEEQLAWPFLLAQMNLNLNQMFGYVKQNKKSVWVQSSD